MSKIAIVGNIDIILIFEKFGFDAYLLGEKEELEEKVDLAIRENNKIIFIQEDLLKGKENLFKAYEDTVYPLIMPLPIYKDLGMMEKMLSQATLKVTAKES